MKKSFKPIHFSNSKILILGSLPGDLSIINNQYYYNKKNRFWKIIFDLSNQPFTENYKQKQNILQSLKISIWDVVEIADRKSSLDNDIKNYTLNNINALLENSNIKLVLFNGKKSKELYDKNFDYISNILYQYLPSTSSANAKYSTGKLIEIWRDTYNNFIKSIKNMKIVVIGSTGFVGKCITNELAFRNHEVLGISRKEIESNKKNVTYINLDIMDNIALSKHIKGYDVVVSAFNAGWENPNLYDDFMKGSESIEKAVKLAQVKRFIIIGGAGSLFIDSKTQAVDTPDFPTDIKPGATAARDYLNIIKNEKDLDWVYFSPSFEMHPGIKTGRTGKYRLGKDNPIFDDNGKSMLSVEDLAVVIADEIEKPNHHQERFTAGY